MACSRCPHAPDVTGVYELSYPPADAGKRYGVECLVVRENGTYEQWFSLEGSPASLINTGAWTIKNDCSLLAKATNEKYLLALDSPVIVDDGFGKPVLPLKRHANATWNLRVRKGANGSVYFPCNDDLGTWFACVGKR
jgi:hypothetical protein